MFILENKSKGSISFLKESCILSLHSSKTYLHVTKATFGRSKNTTLI